MKHLIASDVWKYEAEPFPAYRASLVFGRNKHARVVLPVKGITPALVDRQYLLPDDQFRVIKTREKGTILVVDGSDRTPRCLLLTSCNGGFRGGVGVLASATTAAILLTAEASSALDSAIAVAALFERGQTLAFRGWGRHEDRVVRYTWADGALECVRYPRVDWDALHAAADGGEAL